jgi:hypothetical protein
MDDKRIVINGPSLVAGNGAIDHHEASDNGSETDIVVPLPYHAATRSWVLMLACREYEKTQPNCASA